MYVLVRASSKSHMNVVAIAVSPDMCTLIGESYADADKYLNVSIDQDDWVEGNAFPYCWIPSHNTQYYIREIKYIN